MRTMPPTTISESIASLKLNLGPAPASSRFPLILLSESHHGCLSGHALIDLADKKELILSGRLEELIGGHFRYFKSAFAMDGGCIINVFKATVQISPDD